MRNILLLVLTLSLPNIAVCQKKVQVDSLVNEIKKIRKQLSESSAIDQKQNSIIKELQNKIDEQNNRIESQTSLIDTAFDGVSSQLTASSNFIGIFGIAIAIFTTGLSIYVGRIARNVNQIKIENEILLQKSINVKQEIELLSDKITKNTRGLYLQLRREEINHILNRLIQVPEDIQNVFSSLASDELDDSHFIQMKEAYIQISSDQPNAISYLIQFFQHFAGKSIVDADLKNAILTNLDTCMEACFKNDIVKSTRDYFNELYRKGQRESIGEINAFAKAIGASKYRDLDQVYFAIKNSIPTRDEHFVLYELIEDSPQTIQFRKKFGQLLLDYRADNPSVRESSIFERIEQLNT